LPRSGSDRIQLHDTEERTSAYLEVVLCSGTCIEAQVRTEDFVQPLTRTRNPSPVVLLKLGVSIEGILPSNSSYRIFMQHYKMQSLALGTVPVFSGNRSPLGPGLCRILDMDFGELLFHALR
jgi:hypothetical protein